jgi:hypothetical protein
MEKIGGKILLLALPFIAIQLGASFSLEAGPKRKHDIIYTERWVVEITDGRRETADAIASKNCFNNMGELKISSDRKFFHYELCANEKSSMRTDSPFTEKNEHLFLEPNIGLVEQQIIRPRVSKSYSVPTDPLFSTQWNVLNSGQFGEQFSGNDLNVERAWLQGYSGCNVTVAVVDDGLDIYHNDLWDNFVSCLFRRNRHKSFCCNYTSRFLKWLLISLKVMWTHSTFMHLMALVLVASLDL